MRNPATDPAYLARLINAGRAADVIIRLAELEQTRKEKPEHLPLLITFTGNPEPVGIPSVLAPVVFDAILNALASNLEEAIAETRN